jgi:hypothetical protein
MDALTGLWAKLRAELLAFAGFLGELAGEDDMSGSE